MREDVAQQVDPAALLGRSLHRLADGCLKAPVRVRDQELHTAQPAAFQAREEAGPEHGVLGVPDVNTEDLTPSLGGHARGDHDRTGHDLILDPCLDVGRVKEHVRERYMPEWPLADRGGLTVDVRADP